MRRTAFCSAPTSSARMPATCWQSRRWRASCRGRQVRSRCPCTPIPPSPKPWPKLPWQLTARRFTCREEPVAKTEMPPRHVELGLSDEDVLAMYREMLLARAVDERMWLMQRAGKIAFIISGQGHEGAQVATAWPLRRNQDWMAPYYRSIASAITFGMEPEDIITAHLAKGDDVSSGGRQMPGHYGGAPYNIVSLSSPVGTQVLHAVGIAMGAWVKGEDVVALTSFGEGTSNQGEVHEAMNFAGVHRLPVIFVCENNGYAISVPLDKQVGGGKVAVRAEGYGFPGVLVDGSD